MCGIAGFFGRFEESSLAAMSAAIAHRGPDGDGTFMAASEGVGLAHRRLAIIDVSPSGAQPMVDATTGVAVVFNGEIYNFRELREPLEAAGVRFRGQSDTEVLLQLYLARGVNMMRELNGIFAFALWDPRDRSMLLARDGVGVKPLYVAETPEGVLFGSELKALLAQPTLDRRIDVTTVWSHLTYLWAPGPATMLRSVRKLEPGHAIRIEAGRVARKWCFYELPYPSPRFDGSTDEAAHGLRTLLQTAVTRQMVADVEVGAFLSGGLDSSAVVGFAREKARGSKLACFSIETSHSTAEEGFVDDLPYARRVAAYLGVDLHTVRVGPQIVDRFEEMIWHLDEPQADLAPLNALMICELAREHGIKVLLSGAGGDDIFGGYRRHFALMQERWWAWLPQAAREALAATARRLPTGNSLLRRARKAVEGAGLNGDDRLISYFNWLPPTDGARLFSHDAAMGIGAFHPSQPLRRSLGSIAAEREPLNRMLFLEAKHFLCDHNLNYTDKMGMAVGVEVRVPFLDPDLVAFAASLPPSFKQHGREGKWIFKRAMEGLLPKEVIYRPKTGFGVPLRRWLRRELKAMVDEMLSPASLLRRGLFDPSAVDALRKADAAGRIDAAYPILALCSIESWCRLFIDRKTA
jgi:asparagine synthase (glutamine-hydrolysing)